MLYSTYLKFMNAQENLREKAFFSAFQKYSFRWNATNFLDVAISIRIKQISLIYHLREG